jgi:hypothetical protein
LEMAHSQRISTQSHRERHTENGVLALTNLRPRPGAVNGEHTIRLVSLPTSTLLGKPSKTPHLVLLLLDGGSTWSLGLVPGKEGDNCHDRDPDTF